MRALALVAATGCSITAIQPRPTTLEQTPPQFEATTQSGSFSLGETLKTHHVVLVFYRGFW